MSILEFRFNNSNFLSQIINKYVLENNVKILNIVYYVCIYVRVCISNLKNNITFEAWSNPAR